MERKLNLDGTWGDEHSPLSEIIKNIPQCVYEGVDYQDEFNEHYKKLVIEFIKVSKVALSRLDGDYSAEAVVALHNFLYFLGNKYGMSSMHTKNCIRNVDNVLTDQVTFDKYFDRIIKYFTDL